MSAPPLTRSKHILAFAHLLRHAREPIDRLLRLAKLPVHCLEDGETLIPSEPSFRFRELTARTLGLPNLAVEATGSLQIADLGDFGRTLLRAPTLFRVMSEFCRLMNTQTTMAVLELERTHNNNVSFCHRFLHPPPSGFWQTDLYILQWTIKAVRLADPLWSPSEVWMSSLANAEHEAGIEQMGATVVRARNGCSGFVVPSFMLAMPIQTNGGTPGEDAEERLQATAPSDSYAGAMRQIIETYASDRWLHIREAAEVAGESMRTLQRRLREENATYSEILEETRSRTAARLLETTDTKLVDIALQLGYSNQGNFNRAFRRWAGVTPQQFRDQRTRG